MQATLPSRHPRQLTLRRQGSRSMKRRGLNLAKVRVSLRSLPKESLLEILDRAIDCIPAERLPEVLGEAVPVKEVAEGPSAGRALLKTVRRFGKDTLDGNYYDADSENRTQPSEGTEDWIAEFERLSESCIAQAPIGPPEVVREAFEILFDLQHRIDEGEEIVFFGDTLSSLEFSVDWDRALPAYFGCLSKSATPVEYAKAVKRIAADHAGDDDLASFMRPARKSATPEQTKALQHGSDRRGGR